jgi:hypothetical protein
MVTVIDFESAAGNDAAYEAAAARQVPFEVLYPCRYAQPTGRYQWEVLPCWGVHAAGWSLHTGSALRRALSWSNALGWLAVNPRPGEALALWRLSRAEHKPLVIWLARGRRDLQWAFAALAPLHAGLTVCAFTALDEIFAALEDGIPLAREGA